MIYLSFLKDAQVAVLRIEGKRTRRWVRGERKMEAWSGAAEVEVGKSCHLTDGLG
jgi:hypothetical protein